MNNNKYTRTAFRTLVTGYLCGFGINLVQAATLQPTVTADGQEGQWWNNYNFTITNTTNDVIDIANAKLTFESEVQTGSPVWSGEGVSWPTLVASSTSSATYYLNDVEVQYEDNSWTDTELEPGNSIVIKFGVNGPIGLDRAAATALFTTNEETTEEPEATLSITLTAPQNGAEFTQGEATVFAANAQAEHTTIEKVEFFVNGQLLLTDTESPYEAQYVTEELGEHTLTATAYAINSMTKNDNAVFTVVEDVTEPEQAPTIEIASPSQGQALYVSQPTTLVANVADANDNVARVEFYINDQLLGEVTSSPYSLSWTPATTGSYTISATAIDDTDLQTQAQSVAVNVVASGTGNLTCDITQIYREDGSECMGDDHPRRIIGYFTSWRTGKNGLPSYLAKDLPWDKLTHINYAFASIDPATNQIQVDSSATNMTWDGVPGAEMDPQFAYQGHFNHIASLKKQYPDVKTLISVGGWAETTGFYTMTTDLNTCGLNLDGINTFNASAVNFIRTYGFDGVDVDYEYPSSMQDSGNPNDFAISNQCRAELMSNYKVFMQMLRDALDQAGEADDRKYMLTIAAPSSGYLLRGMEDFAIGDILDFVNIMTYDLHGAWNEFVGPQAALFDNGDDAELASAGVYNVSQYQGIGYLNTAWAYQYFRGAFKPSQINIGIPYYTRGFQQVTGGTNGLWGSATLPNQTECQPGTGANSPCGYGAQGIDNLWHDLDQNGEEIFAGSNPMWHAMNLMAADTLNIGTVPSYANDWGLDENDTADQIQGDYEYHYSEALGASWLWNPTKKVFLSIEDEVSLAQKLDFIINIGAGGMMVWEMAGDYAFDPERGEYYFGDTLTTLAYNTFANASKPDEVHNTLPEPDAVIDISVTTTDWPVGDTNYPINPTLVFTNNDTVAIPTGAKVQFLMSTATGDEIKDWDGAGISVIQSGYTGNNFKLNGQQEDFHTLELELKAGASIEVGAEFDVSMVYYLPVSGIVSGVQFIVGDTVIGLKSEYPHLPTYDGSGSTTDPEPPTGGSSCEGQSIDPSQYPLYPDFPQQDWQGNPSHANAGDYLRHNSQLWQAAWWTQAEPGTDGSWSLVCHYE